MMLTLYKLLSLKWQLLIPYYADFLKTLCMCNVSYIDEILYIFQYLIQVIQYSTYDYGHLGIVKSNIVIYTYICFTISYQHFLLGLWFVFV